MTDPTAKNFLFLQGPHGPFFHLLGKMLRVAGCRVWRVGFNAGDQAFWFQGANYIPFAEKPDVWPETCAALLRDHQITDIVLYGDIRPIHAEAIAQARAANLRIHVFEEGYMRPYWVTYERGGSNGHSRLMDLTINDMAQSLTRPDLEVPTPPAQWGDMRQHIFYGAVYHWFVIYRNRRYPHFARHRALPAQQEARLYTKRLLLMPYIAMERWIAAMRIRGGGYPYHLALLQLEHDASFQAHSPFAGISDFLQVVIEGFANGAPRHHHLILKAHPLDNGRSPVRRIIRKLAATHGVAGRVHYMRGGKLAPLLDHARSAVTVNSSAAQQVLWRGIPLKIFGAAVYDKPDLVSDQPLDAFFAQPKHPDRGAYRIYRRFLLGSSQVPGGFYSTKGRRQIMRQVVDMMLADNDPYDALLAQGDPAPQPLKIVN